MSSESNRRGYDTRQQILEAALISVCAQCLVASPETGTHLSLRELRSLTASVAFHFWAMFSKETQPLKSAKHLIASTGKVMEKEECSPTVGGNANWCSYSGSQYGESSKQQKSNLPCDPAILLRGICPKEDPTPQILVPSYSQ